MSHHNEIAKTGSTVICFFNTAMSWGGGEKWHHDTAILMHRRGHRVLVITQPGSALQQRLPPEIPCLALRVGNLSYLNAGKVFRLKQLLADRGITTLVMNLSADLKLAGLAARLAGVQRLIYRRGSAIPVRSHLVNRFFFRRVLTDVLANSEATKRTVLGPPPGLLPAGKVRVIYNPLPVTSFSHRPYHAVYQPRPGELVLGHIGRMVPQKNQAFLLDLADHLRNGGLSFRLLIAGSGPLEAALRKQVEDRGLGQHVLFTGFLENVKDLLMCCDIFLLPSLWEGFGYVLAEAALCRRPSVAFDLSSNPELVEDGETGYLVPEGDLQAFAEKIRLLGEDAVLRERMGEKGFQYVCDHFADTLICEQLYAYLTQDHA